MNTTVKYFGFLCLSLLFVGGVLQAQAPAAEAQKSFSLKEAIDFALKSNTNYQNALVDEKIALAQKNQVLGTGLPQVSGEFDYRQFIEIPTQVIPADAFGGPPGVLMPVKFGVKFTPSATLNASQLLFSGEYLVGLQASKAFVELSQKNTARTKIETHITVAKAYYNVLVNQQRFRLLEANISRLEKLINDTKALYTNGFVEKIDLDRIEVAYNNLLVEKENVMRFILLSENMLKFQMGMDFSQSISLTDSLRSDELKPAEMETKLNYDSRVEYTLLQSQRKLNELNLKRHRSGYLPVIAAYGVASTQGFSTKFSVFDTQQKWYPYGLFGVKLQLSIFDGLQRHYRIEEAKLNILKTQHMLSAAESAITMDVNGAVTVYNNAIASLLTQKKNIELAENVYKTAKAKYDQGVGSNLEVMDAQTSLKTSQINYYNALYDAYVAKLDYDRALGIIK